MGHYAAEMQCDTCGNLRCTCPPPEKKPNRNFIVNDSFEVMTVDEFDAAVPRLINPLFYRLGKKEFKKRRDAEIHARELCEATVEQARANLAELKNILKVQRPWEEK